MEAFRSAQLPPTSRPTHLLTDVTAPAESQVFPRSWLFLCKQEVEPVKTISEALKPFQGDFTLRLLKASALTFETI